MKEKPIRDLKPKKKEEFVVIHQRLTWGTGVNECYGPFPKMSGAEGWINGRDNPQEYYVLPLNRIPKEEM